MEIALCFADVKCLRRRAGSFHVVSAESTRVDESHKLTQAAV